MPEALLVGIDMSPGAWLGCAAVLVMGPVMSEALLAGLDMDLGTWLGCAAVLVLGACHV